MIRALLIAALLALPALADDAPILVKGTITSHPPVAALTSVPYSLGGTSPASATTTFGPAITNLDNYSKCVVQARIQGGTGGVLDVFIQSSTTGGSPGGWYDLGHFTQLVDGGALAGWTVTFARSAQVATSVNTTDGTLVLAANTFLTGSLGNALRVGFKAGAGTSVGAAQIVTALCSSL